MRSLGDRIKHLRQQKGLTQEELAKIIGISRGSLSMIEIDKREPDNALLLSLADYFSVSIDFLLGREVSGSMVKEDPKRYVTVGDKTYDLDTILETAEVLTVDGRPITEEDRQALRDYIKYGIQVKHDIEEAKKKQK